MWLTDGPGAIGMTFTHVHDGLRRHEHDLAVASIEAHRLCHQLESRKRG